MPYSLLHDAPGFSGIRATARFVVFPLLVLALFAAVGLGSLLAHVRQFWIRAGIVAAVIIVIGAESMVAVAFTEPPHDRASRAVNRALAARSRARCWSSRSGHRTTVGPGPTSRRPGSTWRGSTATRAISGYSGFAPPGFEATAATLESFPSDAAFDRLDDLGVRYVVLRTGVPNGLTAAQAEGVGLDGVGVYSERTPGRSSTRCHRTVSRASTSTATRG